ncbi:MAG: hypothetical protein SPJ04_03380 [Bdellovibrionota bacterium]|nr:hypothetical protein [Pseudomonadota bacterium]MDY6090279.1 hypothetical protein [Bdellovibrionota bacterium]
MQRDEGLFPQKGVPLEEHGSDNDYWDDWKKKRQDGWRRRRGDEPRNASQNAAKEEILENGGCCESLASPSLKMAKRLNVKVQSERIEKVQIRKGNKTKIKTRKVPAPQKGTGRRLRESIRRQEDQRIIALY